MRQCREFRARIPAALEGELAIEQVFALERHCERCGPCRRRYTAARALDAALARLPDPPVEQIDVEREVRLVRAAIEARTQSAQSARNERWATGRAPIARWSLAAAAALIAFALIVELTSREEPGGPAAVEIDPVEPATATSTADATPIDRGGSLPGEPADVPTIVPVDPHTVESTAGLATGPVESSTIDPIDAERLARTREQVREHLRAAGATLAGDAGHASSAFAADFAARTEALARAGWPVLRIVEGSLDDHDPAVARAALCWLGLRGDRLALARVRAALARPDLAEDAVRALADAGDPGLEGLGAALEEPRTRALARAALVARGDAAAAATIEQDIVRAARARRSIHEGPAASAAIGEGLDDLARIGAPALASLLRIGADPGLTEAALAALARAPGAGTALGTLVAAAMRGENHLDALEPELLVRALGRLKPDAVPDAVIDWLVLACEKRELAPAALTCLAGYGTPAALGALVGVHAQGKVADAEVERALHAACAGGCTAAHALAVRSVAGGAEHPVPEPNDLYAALAAALASPFDVGSEPACAAALAVLARSSALTDTDRRSALLVCGEIGQPADAEELALTLHALGPADEDLRAACILSIHALAGSRAVARALEPAPRWNRERVLALLEARESRGRPSTTLLRLARELAPVLAYPNP